MSPALATVVYIGAIAALFFATRDKASRTSWALWIPTAWLAIGASRSISEWLGASMAMQSPDEYLDGSFLDALVFAGLELAAVNVLAGRRGRCRDILRSNGPLLVFFAYCLISVVWSDYPFVAFKRWTKAVGNLLMVLVIVTDPDP